MEKFKGTKGTWIVSKIGAPDSNNEGCGCHTVGTDINQSYGFIDVWFSNIHQPKTMGEALANAQLIAAAPALLEALLNIENDNNSIPEKVWEMRNNAIKKALGQ